MVVHVLAITPQELAEMIEAAVRKALNDREAPGEATNDPGAKRALSIKEAAEFLGVKTVTLYRKTSAGEIPHFKRMGRVYFDRGELENWLLGRKVLTKTDLEKLAGEHHADRARRPR